jgi:hypothetical protein
MRVDQHAVIRLRGFADLPDAFEAFANTVRSHPAAEFLLLASRYANGIDV